MDPGTGHEIEVDLQAQDCPIPWGQYLPTDPDVMDWTVGRGREDGAAPVGV
jgi:hypothetical protein